MKVYFSHGKESGPWGSKITRLAELAKAQGCTVESIDYQGIDDPEKRVELLVSLLKKETGKVLLVGSSMGGYAALVSAIKLVAITGNAERQATEQLTTAQLTTAQLTIAGVFLLAPALYMPGYQVQSYPLSDLSQPAPDNQLKNLAPVAIVHGWADEIIPAEHVIRFAQQQSCSLHLMPGDHRLNSSMYLVEPIFSQFMQSLISTEC